MTKQENAENINPSALKQNTILMAVIGTIITGITIFWIVGATRELKPTNTKHHEIKEITDEKTVEINSYISVNGELDPNKISKVTDGTYIVMFKNVDDIVIYCHFGSPNCYDKVSNYLPSTDNPANEEFLSEFSKETTFKGYILDDKGEFFYDGKRTNVSGLAIQQHYEAYYSEENIPDKVRVLEIATEGDVTFSKLFNSTMSYICGGVFALLALSCWMTFVKNLKLLRNYKEASK